MDLNYLFHRQQVERSNASSANSEAAREAHDELAKLYEDEIRRTSEGKVTFRDRTRQSQIIPRS